MYDPNTCVLYKSNWCNIAGPFELNWLNILSCPIFYTLIDNVLWYTILFQNIKQNNLFYTLSVIHSLVIIIITEQRIFIMRLYDVWYMIHSRYGYIFLSKNLDCKCFYTLCIIIVTARRSMITTLICTVFCIEHSIVVEVVNYLKYTICVKEFIWDEINS